MAKSNHISWQSVPVNGTQRFTRSIVSGAVIASAVVSLGEGGWTYRIYATDAGAFEERLYHAGRELTTSRTRCMREATAWLKTAVGLSP